MTEQWNRAYREAPEMFDAFAAAEDPEGLIARRLLERSEFSGNTVLEIGCGTGRYSTEFAPASGRYVALERSPEMLAIARRRISGRGVPAELVTGDAARLPLAAGSVDSVIAAWVVVHLTDRTRVAALSEINRVMRHGGGVWLLENHWEGEFQELRGSRARQEEVRIRNLIEEHGFSMTDVIDTALRFSTVDEAVRVLGYLCGARVAEAVSRRGRAELVHRVVILHRA